MALPERAEVWLVALGANRDGEPGKHRPAIVVTINDLITDDPNSLIAVVPVSTSRSPSALRPTVDTSEGVERASVAVCTAVRAVARSRLVERLGTVRPETLAAVERGLSVTLGLPREQ